MRNIQWIMNFLCRPGRLFKLRFNQFYSNNQFHTKKNNISNDITKMNAGFSVYIFVSSPLHSYLPSRCELTRSKHSCSHMRGCAWYLLCVIGMYMTHRLRVLLIVISFPLFSTLIIIINHTIRKHHVRVSPILQRFASGKSLSVVTQKYGRKRVNETA